MDPGTSPVMPTQSVPVAEVWIADRAYDARKLRDRSSEDRARTKRATSSRVFSAASRIFAASRPDTTSAQTQYLFAVPIAATVIWWLSCVQTLGAE